MAVTLAVALVVGLAGVATAQKSESQNPVDEQKAKQKVEAPRVSEEDRVKLWVEGVPWFRSMEEEGPIRSEAQDPNEHAAYCYTLVHAHKLPPGLLARHAIKDVTLANLVRETPRKLYRFEPVHFEGRLVQVLRVPKVPGKVRDSLPDLKEYYEGWLFPKDDPNDQPICIQFTELPEGVEAKGRCDYWVAFEGYYFKLLEYPSEERHKSGKHVWRMSPLLIGHSPRLLQRPESAAYTFGGTLVPAILGMLLLIGVVALVLTLWFRRGDRAVRQHLAAPKPNPFANESNAVRPGAGWADFEKKD